MEFRYDQQNRRAFSRVDVYIPAGVRIVPDEERGCVKSRMSGETVFADFGPMPPLDNHPQLEWARELNEKLDRIIHALTLQSQGFHALPFKFVTLSGNGMSFSTHTGFAPGDLLEIKMMLKGYKPIALHLYGEVVKVQRQTSGHFIAVAFRDMDDSIRDQIVRFVFETEREQLRERSKME